jgi:hypothetical protein
MMMGEHTAEPTPCNGPECQGLPQSPTPVTPGLALSEQTSEGLMALLTDLLTIPAPNSWDREELFARPLAGFRMLPDRPPNG